MKAHVHETGGNAFTFRSLFLAVTLIALAFIAALGFSSTSALAADKENVTDIKVPANETVLVSSKTVPIDQEVTQDDYDKLSGQYNVSPNGPNTITSKTQEVESVETKTDTGKKSRTRTTTTYVISGPAATPTPEDTTDGQENPANKLNPLIVAPVAAALTAPAVAVPAALTGAVLNAIPAALTGAALNAIPAVLTGNVLNAIPAALTGAALNAVPAALTGSALKTIPAFTAGVLANVIPAALTGAALNAIPAVLTAAPFIAVPAVLAAAPLIAVPAALAGAALNILPVALATAPLAAIPAVLAAVPFIAVPAVLAAIPFIAVPAVLLAVPFIAIPAALTALGLPVLGFLAIAVPTVAFAAVALPIAGLVGLHILNAPLRLAFFTGLALLGLHILNTPLRLAIEGLLLGDFLLRLAGATAALLNPFDLGLNGFAFPVIALIRNFNFLVLAGLTALALTGLTLGALALGALALGADFLLRLAGALAALLNPLDLGLLGFLFPIIALIRNFNHIVLHTLLRNFGALNALANPFSFGGPLFRLAKGFIFPITETNKNLFRLFLEIPINFIPVTVGLFHALRDPLSWIFFPIGLIKFAVGYLFPLAALYDDLFVWAYWHSVLPFAILSPVFVGSVFGLPVVMIAIGPLGKIAEIINVSLYYWVLCVPLDSLVFMAEVPFTTLRELIRAQVRILLDIFW